MTAETPGTGEDFSVLDGLVPEDETSRAGHAAADAVTDRLVGTLVRRLCLRHPCSAAGAGKPPRSTTASACCGAPVSSAANGRNTCSSCGSLCFPRPCLHRNHRRDVEYAALMLEALGVSGELAREEDYAGQTDYVTLSKREAARLAMTNRP